MDDLTRRAGLGLALGLVATPLLAQTGAAPSAAGSSSAPAPAPAPAGAPAEAVHTIPRFTFENGRSLDGMKVGYATWGRLNQRRDNAILLVPGTSSGRHFAASYIGPGKAFDTDRYFVIGADPIGGGNSSKPADGMGVDFPRYTIRDMVRAQHELVTRGLGLERLLAVGGSSMGSFQGLEWGIAHPEMMRALILWVPAARSDRRFQTVVDTVEAMITLDPGYQGGRYAGNPTEGIRRAGIIYFPWLYSDAYLTSAALRDDAVFDRAKFAFGENWARNWDANSILWRYHASRNHDVSKPFGGDMAAALGRIRAQALVIASSTDRTIAPDLTAEMMQHLPLVNYLRVETDKGHLATSQPEGTPEWNAVNARTRDFLVRLGTG
ncbi:alpha/beta fold hydrolase [Roseomonas sp. NAR14]|uniref:Alpha/beta fold hydrolase n=1 Tax=Roseomonas acroporae TaxID=2937791 RepID=A0A9X1Y7X5_9PROT|nr:alpha/beta fold hydrolase [Roseomonas acroporae]MCK8783737.1 alpha/beta fold hydrolase [Roseomonas acroporae]